MSRKDKLLKRAQEGPKNITFDELLTLMTKFGFTKKWTSHGVIFQHDKLKNKIMPHVARPHGRENKVRQCYVMNCLNAIELLLEEDER